MKYAWIAGHKARWPITLTCAVLEVSASGYFEHWRRKDADKPSRPGVNKRISDEALLVHIKAIHAEVKQEIAPNLLQRNFSPQAPNQVWSSDITYIATDECWLYLTAVLDLFSRQVVGWSMREHMQASVVTDALRMAWFRRRPAPGLIFHSDRDSQ